MISTALAYLTFVAWLAVVAAICWPFLRPMPADKWEALALNQWRTTYKNRNNR